MAGSADFVPPPQKKSTPAVARLHEMLLFFAAVLTRLALFLALYPTVVGHATLGQGPNGGSVVRGARGKEDKGAEELVQQVGACLFAFGTVV